MSKGQGRDLKCSYKWSEEDKIGMAMFLRDNFTTYKKIGGNSGKKSLFLLKMKSDLKFQATDRQIVNGFDALIRKFKSTKDTLASTGFGIDPEKDKSIEEGYIRKQCPYFHILDEVMGDRPNVSPPFTLETGSKGNVIAGASTVQPQQIEEEDSPQFELTLLNPEDYEPKIVNGNPANEDDEVIETTDDKPTSTKARKTDTKTSPQVEKFVQKSFSGLGIKRKSDSKNPTASLLKILSDKTLSGNDVKDKKIKLEREKFEYLMLKDKDDRDQEKEKQKFELEKMKMQQDFELEKLKLQIELAKVAQPNKI